MYVMRRRALNTTAEQYELYLSSLENDEIFRKALIDPSFTAAEVKHATQIWTELVHQLNSVTSGPVLSIDDWKKRFNDWKNFTRSKNRKIKAWKNKMGDIQPVPLKLNEMEKRGLRIWGEGFQYLSVIKEIAKPLETKQEEIEIKPEIFNENFEFVSASDTQNESRHVHEEDSNYESYCEVEISDEPPIKRFKNQQTKDQFTMFTEEMVNSYRNRTSSCQCLTEAIATSIDKLAHIEEVKLKFEVAKYKFENPDFKFDC